MSWNVGPEFCFPENKTKGLIHGHVPGVRARPVVREAGGLFLLTHRPTGLAQWTSPPCEIQGHHPLFQGPSRSVLPRDPRPLVPQESQASHPHTGSPRHALPPTGPHPTANTRTEGAFSPGNQSSHSVDTSAAQEVPVVPTHACSQGGPQVRSPELPTPPSPVWTLNHPRKQVCLCSESGGLGTCMSLWPESRGEDAPPSLGEVLPCPLSMGRIGWEPRGGGWGGEGRVSTPPSPATGVPWRGEAGVGGS